MHKACTQRTGAQDHLRFNLEAQRIICLLQHVHLMPQGSIIIAQVLHKLFELINTCCECFNFTRHFLRLAQCCIFLQECLAKIVVSGFLDICSERQEEVVTLN